MGPLPNHFLVVKDNSFPCKYSFSSTTNLMTFMERREEIWKMEFNNKIYLSSFDRSISQVVNFAFKIFVLK